MQIQQLHRWLYLTNATVLLAHQIDAAYWHEWQLFGLPGGVQLYLILNLPIIGLMLYGQQGVALDSRSGMLISWLVVGSGLFAFGIHSFFLWQGDASFKLPVSLGLLLTTLILSLSQAATLVGLQRTWH